MPFGPDFDIALRGYDRREVDAVVGRAEDALASGDPAVRAEVRDELARAEFHVVLRGYDRRQVDEFLRRLGNDLARA